MPNHCYNSIDFKSVDAKKEFFQRLHVKPKKNEFSFQWLVPQPASPEECERKFGHCFVIDSEDDRQDRHISILPGKAWFDWYSWQNKFWGTKWDAYDVMNTPDSPSVWFMTAWNPPVPVFQKIAETASDLIDKIIFAGEMFDFAGSYNLSTMDCDYCEATVDLAAIYDNLTGSYHFQDPDTGDWIDDALPGVFYVDGKPHYLDIEYADDDVIIAYHKKYGDPFDRMALDEFAESNTALKELLADN